MMTRTRLRSARWMLLALLALTPTALLAEQDPAVQDQDSQGRDQPEAVQAEADPAQAQADPAKAETDPAQTEVDPQQTQSDGDGKLTQVPGGTALGMSILGNQEAPTSLVIVPWKSSELGHSPGVSTLLDDSRQPVDKEVFMRALSYYELRSGTQP